MVIMDALASIQCVMHYWECPLTTWTEPFCNLSSCSAQTISPAQLLIPSSLHICNKFQTKAIVLTLLYFFFLFHCFKLVSATSNSDLNHGDCNLMLRLLCLFFSIFLLIIFCFFYDSISPDASWLKVMGTCSASESGSWNLLHLRSSGPVGYSPVQYRYWIHTFIFVNTERWCLTEETVR